MGYFIRLILAIVVINFVIRSVFRIFFGWRRRKSGYNPYTQQQQRRNYQSKATPKKPETQEERILDFQKKSFDSSKAEDADFIEIKDN